MMPKLSGCEGVEECAMLFECWAMKYDELDMVNADGLTRDAIVGLSVGMYVALESMDKGYDSEQTYLTAAYSAGRVLQDLKERR